MADDVNKKDDNSSEEYLKEYLGNSDYKENNKSKSSDTREDSKSNKGLGSVKDLEFLSIDINELPCKFFYPSGSNILVRAAKVEEIQAFSVVDDNNFYDIFEKVNHLVQSCAMIQYPDGSKKPYTHLIDGDRWYLLFVIRELTFQKGNDLYTSVNDIKIPIKRGHFTFHEMDEKLKKFYDRVSGKFIFKTKSGSNIEMAPPTLGLQKSFTDYMLKEVQSKKTLNESFLKVIPYTMPGKTSITEQGIKQKVIDFKNLDLAEFQFLNGAVNKMSFGISGVKGSDESGLEVHSEEIFPEGVSQLFVSPDAFDTFLA